MIGAVGALAAVVALGVFWSRHDASPRRDVSAPVDANADAENPAVRVHENAAVRTAPAQLSRVPKVGARSRASDNSRAAWSLRAPERRADEGPKAHAARVVCLEFLDSFFSEAQLTSEQESAVLNFVGDAQALASTYFDVAVDDIVRRRLEYDEGPPDGVFSEDLGAVEEEMFGRLEGVLSPGQLKRFRYDWPGILMFTKTNVLEPQG